MEMADIPLYIHNMSTNNNPPLPASKKKLSSASITLGSLQEELEDSRGADGLLSPPGNNHNLLTVGGDTPPLNRGRRRSWQVGMKKRRPHSQVTPPRIDLTAPDDDPPPFSYDRTHKRHSWWSIFVPDNIGTRIRRPSEEGPPQARPSFDSQIPWLRSKSRSVDHGITAPFEHLRAKAEGRRQRADTDGEGGSRESLAERKMSTVPIKTTTYTVEPSDTLTSVAAHFDTTPSELVKLNRLASRTVFPGQRIWVPDKSGEGGGDGGDRGEEGGSGDGVTEGGESAADNSGSEHHTEDSSHPHHTSHDKSDHTDEEDILETLRVSSPKPGHVERVGTPSSPSLEKFLKINVRHITDGQGVVSGVLLVTPNAVMFDPNVSDPLVIERGPESYGVIAPMEYVVNAAIYHDIAHMRVGSSHSRCDMPKPEVYRMKSEDLEGDGDSTRPPTRANSADSREPSTKETLPDLRSSTEEDDSCWREGDAFPKAFERDLVTPTNVAPEKPETGSIEEEGDKPDVEREGKEGGDMMNEEEGMAYLRKLDERRKSCLDHHWAVPSQHSLERDHQGDTLHEHGEDDAERQDRGSDGDGVEEGQLVKLSCHDSGIDIRDPPPPPPLPPPLPPAMPRKTVYSDADILLAGDGEFVPPVPVVPFHPPLVADEKKKQQSVSFSLDEDQKKEDDKQQDTKKTKMLKRLSYPLAWMEGITGSDEKEVGGGSLPTSADSHPSHSSSVFSKVFTSSPINMVTDFGSGLFTKTPSEDSSGGRFPFPPSCVSSLDSQCATAGSAPSSAPSSGPNSATMPSSTSSSFSPSNIISSVGRSSVGTFIRTQHAGVVGGGAPQSRPPGPKLDYRSMVSVEDMPELFVSFDKLIPRPARSCEDPPLYLRLRMGKPKDTKIPKYTPIMSYGKKKMRPEYWFSVPRERVDELYRFLMAWVGHLYGDLDEEVVTARGFELVDSDTELWDSEDGGSGGATGTSGSNTTRRPSDTDITRESWEVLSMSGELRRALYSGGSISEVEPFFLPDLSGTTEILTEEHRKQLCTHLPARAEGYVWTLVFSTSQHGFSLNSMYRKMTKVESPILMVIQDTEKNVFGALTSCSLKVSDHFYGTGESLLFRFAPDCQVFNWTGENMYFIKGNNESLSIGAGDGKFGLWLDGDLYQGRTEPCGTYNNEPLTPSQDFVVKTLECWAFV